MLSEYRFLVAVVALAARALGLLMLEDAQLRSHLRMDADDLVDALLQIVNFCRHASVQNGDTRRIHVNCCLTIALLMQGASRCANFVLRSRLSIVIFGSAPQQHHVALLVSLDSELLIMRERPDERTSTSLLLTVAGRPSSAQDKLEEDVRAAPIVASIRHSTMAANNRAMKKNRRKKHDVMATFKHRSPSKLRRIAWDPPSGPDTSSPKDGREEHDIRQEVELTSQKDASDPHSKLFTPMASNISARRTPKRAFYMDRFRVMTPAFADSPQRLRLPVIPPSAPAFKPSSSLMVSNSVNDEENDMSPDTVNDTSTRPRLSPNEALLEPQHMLTLFRTQKMPMVFSSYFKHRLQTVSDEAHQLIPDCKRAITWDEWQRRGLSDAAINLPSNESYMLEHPAPASLNQTNDAWLSSLDRPVSRERALEAEMSLSIEAKATESVENVNTPEYRRKRLRDILSSPIEPHERNSLHLQTLAKRVHTTTMSSLEMDLDLMRKEEARVRQGMHALIQSERDRLPLKFLFQLPGGAAYCRHRMRQAMALWILEFERNQQRMALMQWKAFVEHYRFKERGQEYRRLAVIKRLQVAMAVVLKGYLQQALKKWTLATQLMIWIDRDCAVRKIQGKARQYMGRQRFLALHDLAPFANPGLRDVYLAPWRDLPFEIPVRVRNERRSIWIAADLVQCAYRRRRFRFFLGRYRDAATKIQAVQRMRAARCRYERVRQRIIAFQSYVRRNHCYKIYHTLRKATLLVQAAFRSMRIRRLRRLIVCAQRQEQERILTQTLLLQRVARGFLGRCVARGLRRIIKQEFHAALILQRSWYRRNNEWSTFLLLGCLREKEYEEVAFNKAVLVFKRNCAAKLIKRSWCSYLARKRNRAALMIQRNYRRLCAQRLVENMRRRKMAHRRIKWFLRVHHAQRIREATKLQFWWLRAVPRRLYCHLHTKRIALRLKELQLECEVEYDAATRIQSLVRAHNDRKLACQERKARVIQRTVRDFLLWRRIKRKIARIKSVVSHQVGNAYVNAAFHAVYETKMKACNFGATQLQRLFRGYAGRNALARLIVYTDLQAKMVSRIQSLWRHNKQIRLAKKLMQAQKRKRLNPFRLKTSMGSIIAEMMQMSSGYYDPADDLKGMAIAMWLRRQGFDEKYLSGFQKSRYIASLNAIHALDQMRQLGPDLCRDKIEAIGVQDDDDLQAMLTNLFASQTIQEAKTQRMAIRNAKAKQQRMQRSCDFALMQVRTAQAKRNDTEMVLTELLEEAKDFRNPPKGLRRKIEARTKDLESELSALNRLETKHRSLETVLQDQRKRITSMQEVLSREHEANEVSALYSLKSMKPIDQLNVAREMFLVRFPGLEARALTFVGSLDDVSVTTWQLERFFWQHSTVSEVKQNMKTLTYFSMETETKRHDHARFTQCLDILQFGYERLCELTDIPLESMFLRTQEQESDDGFRGPKFLRSYLLPTFWHMQSVGKLPDRARLWRQAADELAAINAAAIKVQSSWRGRVAKKLLRSLFTNKHHAKLRAQYLDELHADHVRPVWEADRKAEQEELDAWLAEQALEHRLAILHEVVRYPYFVEWDESSECCVYYYIDPEDSMSRVYIAEKPVYTIEEEDAAIKIQSSARRYLCRVAFLMIIRDRHRQRKRNQIEQTWNLLQHERVQSMTLRFQLTVQANQRVILWSNSHSKSRKASVSKDKPKPKTTQPRSNNTLATSIKQRRAVSHQSTGAESVDAKVLEADIEAFKQRIEPVMREVHPLYHKTVRATNRRDWAFPVHSRPPNVHAQVLLGLLDKYRLFQRLVAPNTHAYVTMRFTRVDLRFGWQEVRPLTAGTRLYYYNPSTNETSWDRPTYHFDEEYAAIKIQSVGRMLIAKQTRQKEIESISYVDTIHKATSAASKIGWIGYGLEGISGAVYLSRLGLSKYISALAKSSAGDIAHLSETKMKKLNWTKEEMALLKQMPQTIKRKFPCSSCVTLLAPSTKHPFNFIAVERAISQLVSQSFPNQQGRIAGLVQAIRNSITPITYRQLEVHLRKYAGRPDDALANISEIASLEYATQERQEREVYQQFLRCVERCVVFAANLRLTSLQRELSNVLVVVMHLLPETLREDPLMKITATVPLVATRPEEQSVYLSRAIERYPARISKGLWERDVKSSTPVTFSSAQLALYLRELGLERVLLWIRSALICQSSFRMHKVRQWYRATLACRAYAATQIQCAWRIHCAVEFAALLESQQRSEYEQCHDAKTKTFYFVYKPTKEKLLDEPQDAQGAIIPYRPMIQDRLTKRWMLAWPHYTGPRKNKLNERRESRYDTQSAPCSVCHAERAARRCNECYSPAGDFIDYCLVCFYDAHAPENTATNWHSYESLHEMKTRFFHCIECRHFASSRCLQCDENYCERCFYRLHGKGHIRTTHRCEFYEPMAQVCVECETRVAFQLCLVCQDALCESCMTRTHAKGKKASHELRLIKQTLASDQMHCDQCHARRGDGRCEYCALALCQPCLNDKHALICPETELNQKRRTLLGDMICVECGKAADRECTTCGDRYCSVRWMGNPGCFETFHYKGRRTDHVFTMLEAPTMTREILDLEHKVRLKRKLDAENAEREAKAMTAAMLALADDASRDKQQRQNKRAKKAASNRKLLARSNRCCVANCGQPARQGAFKFCLQHFTMQHALEVTQQDPLEAAKLIAEVAKEPRRKPLLSLHFLSSSRPGSKSFESATKKSSRRTTKKPQQAEPKEQ